jgi:DNA invertase Pin-like site-specific DNA recombinase
VPYDSQDHGLNAIGYIRVSTNSQAVEGVGLDVQKARIEAWCTGHGYTLRGLHADEGLSGGRADNRPGLSAAVSQACHMGGVLVVFSLTRLARSTKDAIEISDELHEANADLVSLSENIDTTTAAGKMVFRMLAVLAEFERDLVGERTAAALAHKKALGQRVGTLPYGYTIDDDGKTLVREPQEYESIRLILNMRSAGSTLRQIRDELGDRCIANRNGSRRWRLDTINAIIKRET